MTETDPDGPVEGPTDEQDAVPEPEAEPQEAPADSPEEPEPADDALTAALEEVAQWKGRAARAQADYDNLQKRVARDAQIERERVKARVLEHFLQVYEYSRMAAHEAEKAPGPLAEGIKMVVREFERLLDVEGVHPIGEVGEPFSKDRHEAVAEEPNEDVGTGHIARVVQPGYMVGERVLRYAKVAVVP